MRNEKVYLERINRFTENLKDRIYTKVSDLKSSYIYDTINPIPYEKALEGDFKEISVGDEWGKLWGCGWFKFKGDIPKDYEDKEYGALLDISGEGCLFIDGSPYQGITNKIDWDHHAGKYYIKLNKLYRSGNDFELLIEAGANGLFGGGKDSKFSLVKADFVVKNREIYKLWLDLFALNNLMARLDTKSPRRKKIMYALNKAINLFDGGKGVEESLKITADLLSKKSSESSMDIYSIGHAHIDMAWLWPIRETRRKAGRTFSTALRMMEEYPEYKFGASQPQLYQWVKEDYPKLFSDIQDRVKDGRWEVQGAMWVEPDMNITGGESLVRQCFYGLKYYKDHFNKEVKNLWLPDVFGYSAALPQILKGCGVDYFMTQKISWNETNVFPFHTFMWKGIDGTEIFTHFLPTNDYNLSNIPQKLIDSEERFAQSDICNEFLNLYGVGDGGGGPSDLHIELGLRQQDLEGTPRFKFDTAENFFEKTSQVDHSELPKWDGELYLELHRGTYTTQGKTKRNNRELELGLRDLEFLSLFTDSFPKERVESIWKDTLLNQFHDILPGSSITWVYEDENRISEENLSEVAKLKGDILNQKFDLDPLGTSKVIINTLSWEREELVKFKVDNGSYVVADHNGIPLPSLREGDEIKAMVKVPSMGYTTIKLLKTDNDLMADRVDGDVDSISNNLIDVKFGKRGEILSIFDKELNREILKGVANDLSLYEDIPNNWEAWDVNHYYREMEPEKCEVVEVKLLGQDIFETKRYQKLKVGNSIIEQWITIGKNSKEIRIENRVEWNEERKMLRGSAELDIHTTHATFEIQYGNVKRELHSNTSWDMAKFEVAAHRYVDLSTHDFGIALLNNCKYGHYVKGNILDINLLRSPNEPDPKADRGVHHFTYSYLPHRGSFEESDVFKKAHNLNAPLIVHSTDSAPSKKEESFFSFNNDGLKIEVVKPAESEDGTILRIYETSGRYLERDLTVSDRFKSYCETDMVENELEPFSNIIEGKVKLSFNPYQIRTFKLK